MGFWDRLLGTDDTAARQAPPRAAAYDRTARPANQPPRSEDEIAVERYRYLLRTAPPETIEQVHAEAFAKLTEPQRQQVLADLSAGLSATERPASTDPRSMARAATRAESMNPGFMERTLGAGGSGAGRPGPSFGSMVGSSILGTVAGYVIGSTLVSAFMAPAFAYDQGYGDGATGADTGGADTGGADAGTADASAADGGWGGADFGGDFGGGDFGGFDGF